MATSFHLLTVLSDLVSGVGIPPKAQTVKPFSQERYLGKWYEIARFDYYFERDLDNVTATYSKRAEGKIKIDNKGFNFKEDKWEESIGKAVPLDDPQEARLKVSFFGPFYSGYNVIALDADYKYAMVAGKNLDYLWLLSRKPDMPQSIKDDYIARAEAIGYEVGKLIWVDQSKNAA